MMVAATIPDSVLEDVPALVGKCGTHGRHAKVQFSSAQQPDST
ncbi:MULTISPECIES: hypothetical protein [Leifsonia]|uniref:Uncharacterized protein n=1 Tax=Leifsonia shinshuensis TaxID=150026 RepID=A0A853CLP6_9MICO|nr:hypothetical protein [Leifsonia sp. PS1209]NYJ21726.1 hypothetical protein [Leifsonia shinshuensis]